MPLKNDPETDDLEATIAPSPFKPGADALAQFYKASSSGVSLALFQAPNLGGTNLGPNVSSGERPIIPVADALAQFYKASSRGANLALFQAPNLGEDREPAEPTVTTVRLEVNGKTFVEDIGAKASATWTK